MNRRLIAIFGEVNKKSKYYSFLRNACKRLENTIVVEYTNKQVDFKSILDTVKKESIKQVIFFSTNVYGPIRDLRQLLDAFESQSDDVIGLIHQPPFSEGPDELYGEGISTECFAFSSRIITEQDIEYIFEQLLIQGKKRFIKESNNDIIKELRDRGYDIGGLINSENFACFSIDAGYDYVKNKSYELLAETVCPFVFKKRFEADNNLTDDLNRMLDYIRDNSDYNIDLMMEDVARTINPLDSKRNLNLNYIFPSRVPLYSDFDEKIYDETAVFAHIYYEDRIDNCFEYLTQIPKKIKKYITTSNPVTYDILSGKLKLLDDTWDLKLVKNHGRDISALWVVDAPIIKKYKYICYVHDKKTSGQKGNILNGDYYHYNVWENSLKSAQYINNVLYTLSSKAHLGFLSPPFPIFFDYKGLLGYEWTICFEPTVELAKDLKIKANIDASKPPFAFSNTFWAKTDALMPLIDRKLKYDDFPGEPLPTDGSISHAIERRYIYVAQSRGYLSGIMEHEGYASMELNSMQKIMAERNIKYNEMWAERDQQCQRAEQLQKERDLYKDAIKIASDGISAAKRKAVLIKPEGNLYIYGSGKIGRRTAQLLLDNGCKIQAFLVSDGQEIQDEVNGIKCYHFSDVTITKDDNVIVALNASNYEQVKELLEAVPNKLMYSEIDF